MSIGHPGSMADDWATPGWLVSGLSALFGPFDLDPAATPASAKAPVFFTREDDGLAQPWTGRVFLNPPYGRALTGWLAKARAEVASGRAELVVCLVPVRTGTRWWADATASASLILFWPARIKFGATEQGAPGFDSALIIYGALPGRHGSTPRWCAVCNGLFWPAYACRETCSERCRKAAYRSRI
jgi:phage N-6-adenine-methyltransferase